MPLATPEANSCKIGYFEPLRTIEYLLTSAYRLATTSLLRSDDGWEVCVLSEKVGRTWGGGGMVQDLWFRVWGLGSEVQVQGFGVRAHGLELRV